MSGAPAEVGSTANNYQILARLAVGGMAEIFLARGASTAGVERYCVLKRILRDRASDVHFVRMFLDEARLAAQLNHPNVAQVYDIGKLGDSYFFTMEYVHGETVRAVIQRAKSLRREIPLAAVLTMVAGTASGLHHAHERLGFDGRPLGIVHRDVSPSNLMVSYEGGVKVVDFGVAKAADRMQETRSGTVKGKISYLSPEQCRGISVDRRSDLFALGIVMWEMLTTERLYRRASDFENMNAIVNEPPPPPSSRRRGLPPELDAITMQLLSKDANARFQTSEDLVEALEQAAAATGAMISSAGLGRLLREMFGQRPEPWLELDPAEVPEGVTVTSEPIPSELGVPIADSVDLHLSEIPDFSKVSPHFMAPDDGVPRAAGAHAPSSPHVLAHATKPGTRNAVVTHLATLSKADLPAPLPPPPPAPPPALGPVPSPGQSGELPLPAPPLTLPEVLPNRTHPVSGPNAPTLLVPQRPSAPSLPVTPRSSVPSISHGEAGGRRSVAAIPTSIPGPGSGGHALPGSGGHALPGSGAQEALAAVGALASQAPLLEEKPARSWPMIAVIGAAAVIGSLTVWIVMKTGGGGGTASVDAAVAVASERSDAPVAEPAPAPRPVVTEILPPPPAPADAAEPVATIPDAAPPDAAAPPADAAAPPADAATARIGSPPLPQQTPLDIAMNDQRYDEVVGICSKRITAETAAACTFAACRERAEAKARQWFGRVPAAGRAKVLGSCRGAGIDLAPPRRPAKSDAGVEDRCEIDPMACQH